MNNTVLSIAATVARSAVERTEGGLEEKGRAAMKEMREFWMDVDDDLRFRGAVAGLMISYPVGSDERLRIESTLRAIQKFNAIITAAQAGLTVNATDMEAEEGDLDPVPLMAWWHESGKNAVEAGK